MATIAIMSTEQFRPASPLTEIDRCLAQVLAGREDAWPHLCADESAECQDKPRLTRSDVQEGIKSIRADVMACGARAEGIYKVKMTIGPDGRVTSAETRDDDVGECIVTEVKKARFARSCKGMSVTYPFVFRRAPAE